MYVNENDSASVLMHVSAWESVTAKVSHVPSHNTSLVEHKRLSAHKNKKLFFWKHFTLVHLNKCKLKDTTVPGP